MRNRPFLLSGILGLGTIAMTLVLTLLGPRPVSTLPQGFITPVLAFEFAETVAEVRSIFEPIGQPAGEAVRQSMDRLNRIDFVYMVLYTGLMFTFAVTAARLTGKSYFYIPAIVALAVLVGDIMENVQLLDITSRLESSDFEPQLARLKLFTWLKWGGLALYFVLILPYFVRSGWLNRLLLIFGGVPLLSGTVAYFNRGLMNELFVLSIGLMFFLLTVYSFVSRSDQNKVVI